MLDVLFIAVGLVLLILGGNWLLKSAIALSLKLSIPKIVIGMTVVSLATSAPELIISVKAALDGSPDLALSNVVGSNIANLGLVLGITVVMGTIDVKKSFYTTDWPVMMVASVLFVAFVYFDSILQPHEGIIMVAFLFVFLLYLLCFHKTAQVDELAEDDAHLPLYRTALLLGIGSFALWSGSELLVSGAKNFATSLGVSERIVGISVISVGTSIPELASSIIAVLKKEKAISVGNLIGSNIFNLLAVLGITSIITPVQVLDQELLTKDIFWMLGISFIILPLVFLPNSQRLGWRDGIILLGIYACFIYNTLL